MTPKKKKQESQEEQSERFRQTVPDFVAAGELIPPRLMTFQIHLSNQLISLMRQNVNLGMKIVDELFYIIVSIPVAPEQEGNTI